MNIRKIKILRRRSWLGKLLRLPFRLIPGNAVLPIVSGFLRGKKWIKGSHNLSVVLGTYERRQTKEFIDCARTRNIFWDLGAHVGYYSLLYCAANPRGKSFGFEPLPLNADLQKRHMTLNALDRHQIFVVAVSDAFGELSFDLGKTSVAGKLSDAGTVKVDVVRLSEWAQTGKVPLPELIKMDIEGEEFKVLKDIEVILVSARPDIFLSTHGKDVHNQCVKLLQSLDYTLTPLDAPDLVNCRELLARSTNQN